MKVLAIPDIHLPFTNWVKLQAVAKLALRLNVDRVVQLGGYHRRVFLVTV